VLIGVPQNCFERFVSFGVRRFGLCESLLQLFTTQPPELTCCHAKRPRSGAVLRYQAFLCLADHYL
jgi:hypothetical protein